MEFGYTIEGQAVKILAPEPGEFDGRAFKSFLSGSNGMLGVDTESTSGNMFRLDWQARLCQVATPVECWILDLMDEQQWKAAADVLGDDFWFFTWNSTEAEFAYREWGLDMFQFGRYYDLMVNALLCRPGEMESHGLKDWSEEFIDDQLKKAEENLHARFRELWLEEHKNGKWADEIKPWGWDNIPQRDEAYLRYAGLDAVYAIRMLPHIERLLETLEVSGAVNKEQRIHAITTRMCKFKGWLIDRDRMDNLLSTVGQENHKISEEYLEKFEHSVRSPKRVALVQSQGVALRVKTKGGGYSLSKEVLKELSVDYSDNEAIQLMYEHSKTANVTQFLTTLETKLGDDDRARPNTRTLGTVTGRWQVTRPAMQTVSVKSGARSVFIPEPGHVILSADLANIEPRIGAALSGARSMIQTIKDGKDVYEPASIAIAGPGWTKDDRKVAKRIVLGTLYAAGVNTLYNQARYTDGMLGVTRDSIAKARTAFKTAVPELDWLAKRLAQEDVVRLESGRFVPQDDERRYKAINSVIQGTARDELMNRMVGCVDAGLSEYMLFTMHDEILFSVPEEELYVVGTAIKDVMECGYKGLPTPSDLEVYPHSWGDIRPDGKPWTFEQYLEVINARR